MPPKRVFSELMLGCLDLESVRSKNYRSGKDSHVEVRTTITALRKHITKDPGANLNPVYYIELSHGADIVDCFVSFVLERQRRKACRDNNISSVLEEPPYPESMAKYSRITHTQAPLAQWITEETGVASVIAIKMRELGVPNSL